MVEGSHASPSPDTESVDPRIAEFRSSANCDPAVADEIIRIVFEGTEFDCYKMNPLRIAQASGFDRDMAIRCFLYATKLGILDLNWDIHCPSCHGIPEYHRHLMGLRNTAHCDLCAIDWDLDFDAQVEVTFTVNPDLRRVSYADWQDRVEFRDKMQFLEDVLTREGRDFKIGICIDPGETKTVEADFEPGKFRFYMPSHLDQGGFLEVTETDGRGGKASSIALVASGSGVMSAKNLRAPAGRISFEITSDYPHMNGFLVKSTAPPNNWLSAAQVTSLQDFRDLFSGEFLSPDTSFAVKSVTLLFTDVLGSTRLYERVGDAGAFSAVKEHFDIMSEIIRRHRGCIVKTIGDAVMASFPVNLDGVKAAWEIQETFSAGKCRNGEILVKIGLHRGPAITVTSNDRLDFFGRTVNIAARVQGESRENEVLMSPAVASDPDVKAFLAGRGHCPATRKAVLKGIDGDFAIHAISFGRRNC